MKRRYLFFVLITLAGNNSASAAMNANADQAKKESVITKKEVYDLYLKTSGVKLNDVLAAVDGNKDAQKKLQGFATNHDSMQVLSRMRDFANTLKENCLKNGRPSGVCSKETAPLIGEIDKLQDISGKANSSKLTPELVRWHLVVLDFVVERDVIGKFLEKWEEACMSKGKMNEPGCQASLQSFNDLSQLMKDVLVYQRKSMDKDAETGVNKKNISNMIASFEK